MKSPKPWNLHNQRGTAAEGGRRGEAGGGLRYRKAFAAAPAGSAAAVAASAHRAEAGGGLCCRKAFAAAP